MERDAEHKPDAPFLCTQQAIAEREKAPRRRDHQHWRRARWLPADYCIRHQQAGLLALTKLTPPAMPTSAQLDIPAGAARRSDHEGPGRRCINAVTRAGSARKWAGGRYLASENPDGRRSESTGREVM